MAPSLLQAAKEAYNDTPVEHRNEEIKFFTLSISGLYHHGTSQFRLSETEMRSVLEYRLATCQPDDLLVALAYSWLSMAIASQPGKESQGLPLLLSAGEILQGPAGSVPGRDMIWRFNTARNHYVLGRYDEAEKLLLPAVEEADRVGDWYCSV